MNYLVASCLYINILGYGLERAGSKANGLGYAFFFLTVDDVRERNRRNKKKSLTMYDGITYVELGTSARIIGEITHSFDPMTCAFATLYGKLQVVEGYGSRVYTHYLVRSSASTAVGILKSLTFVLILIVNKLKQ